MRRACVRVVMVAVCGLMLACQPRVESEYDHRALSFKDVTLNVVSEDSAFAIPWQLRVLDDSTLLTVDMQQPYFHLVDRRSGRVHRSFGRAGRGPGEYVSQPQVAIRRDHPRSWLAWTRELSRLTFVEIGTSRGRADSTLTVGFSGAINNPMGLVDDSTVLLSAATDTSGVVMVDTRTGALRIAGSPMRFMHPDSMTPSGRRQLSSTIIACLRPRGDSYFRASQMAGRAEIVAIHGGDVDTVAVPYPYEPYYEYDLDDGGGYVAQWNRHQRRAYQDCAATDQLILALFSGRLRGAYENQWDRILARFIHVFDWSGQLLTVLRLPEPAWSIAYDEQRQVLYLTRWDPVPGILRADLAGLLPAAVNLVDSGK